MPRPKHIDRPVKVGTVLPASIKAKIDEQLFSDLEGRVPYGAFQSLVEGLLTQWLKDRGVEV